MRNGIIESINPSAIPTDISDIYDGKDRLIAPGLINTHSHLAMVLLRGWAESVNLDGFLELVWAAEGAIMDKQTCALGTELGAAEALKGGTTTVLDMYLNPDATHAAAVRTGLRHVAGPIFFDFPGLDGMQWDERISFGRKWPSILAEIGGGDRAGMRAELAHRLPRERGRGALLSTRRRDEPASPRRRQARGFPDSRGRDLPLATERAVLAKAEQDLKMSIEVETKLGRTLPIYREQELAIDQLTRDGFAGKMMLLDRPGKWESILLSLVVTI